MVATKINTGPDADGALRWFESTRKLLWLRVRDAIAPQMTPGTGDGAKPIFHLRDDEAAELLVGKLLRAEDGDGDQRFSGGSVGRSDLADHREVVDGASSIAVQHEHWMGHGRLVRRKVKTGDAARGGFGLADEMSGAWAIGRHNDCASAQRFTTGKRELIFVKRFGMGVQAKGVRGQVRGNLRGDCSHTAGGNGDVALGEHLKNEFEHAARGFQFAVKKNAAKKRSKKSVNEFFGKSCGNEGV